MLPFKLKPCVFALVTTLSLAACKNTPVEQTRSETAPLNIIMIVADGMGPAYTTAYRYYKDDPTTAAIEPTIFDKYKVGAASTSPAEESGYVTDSAAAATALASGIKSYNGAIGVDVNKKPVETVLHRAKLLGKNTGVIVTSQVVHATPASYIAHNEKRRNYNEIADSFFNDKLNGQFKADVILGGGQSYFIRDDKNLVEQFTEHGFQYVDTYAALASAPIGKPLLGLFAPIGLPAALDSDDKHRLKTLTEQGLKHLENPNGYFVLLEASQIDWAGHDNDIAGAMAEMDDLAATLAYLENYVAHTPNTLVILTADHSTGGLTIGRDGIYQWQPEELKGLSASSRTIAAQLMASDSLSHEHVNKVFGKTLTEAEYQQLSTVDKNERRAMHKAVTNILSVRSNTGWTTGGHTGIDVEVFAFGQHSEMFQGQQDNTDIAKKLFKLLENQ